MTYDSSAIRLLPPAVLSTKQLTFSLSNYSVRLFSPAPDDSSTLLVLFRNEAENQVRHWAASVRLICNDPWITSIAPTSIDLPNIPPGATISPTHSFFVTVDYSIFTGVFNFEVEVFCKGWTYWKDSMLIIITDIKDQKTVPLSYNLDQIFPNPFNSTTVIKYSIPEVSQVGLKLFNLLGEEVVTLVNEEKVAGYYTVEFNAANLPSGVYFYQIQAGDYINTKKMILLK